jgi:hypothetical protein
MRSSASNMDAHAYIAALPGHLASLDGERVLWQQHGGPRIAALPAIDATVLAHAARFETRDAHLEAITATTRLAREQVDASLGRLAAQGLLQPLPAFLPPATAAVPPPPPPLLAVRTCARPASLGLLLRSALDDEHRFDLRRRYVVLDDTLDPALAAATRAEVEAFAQRSASEVRLVGAAERAALLDFLGEAALPLRELLDPLALSSASGGRTWNWASLLAAGGTLGLLDDDFRFPLRLPSGAAPAFDLVTEYALETEFLDGPDALDGLAIVEEDPYALLLRHLGQPAGALLQSHGCNPDSARRRTAASLHCLAPPARVAAVCGGVHGELPFDSSVHLSMPSRATLGSLLRPPFDEQRLQADNLWQGRRRPHFMATGVFTPLLLDARELLPPTGTLGKADDALFMALLSASDPTALALAVPASIGHFPPLARDRRAAAESAAIEDLSTFAASQVLGMAPLLQSSDRASRLAAIAAILRDAALGSDAALSALYLGWRDRHLLGVIQPLYRSLREHGGSAAAAWVEHVRRAITANEMALRERIVAPQRITAARATLAQLAGALSAWPALWARGGTALLAQLPPLR